MVDAMTEVWRDISDAPGYQVSNLARVRSLDRHIECKGHGGIWVRKPLKGKILTPTPNCETGYYCINLGRKDFRKLHHIVLEAFVAPRPAGLEGAHLDGCHTNNLPSNLAWVTHQENIDHKHLHGRMGRGEAIVGSKLISADIFRVREANLFGARSAELAGCYGVSRSCIDSAISRKSWKHL